jgi:signal transduction histidine kinase
MLGVDRADERLLWAAATLLGAESCVESVLRPARSDATPRYVLVLCLVGLATTLPLASRQATVSALTVTAACALSLAGFSTLTLGGIAAQLAVAYRCRQAVAFLLGVPALLLALTEPGIRQTALVLASLVPVAAGAGTVRRTRRTEAELRADRSAIADRLVEHGARGERARIVRDLHDVVAHHVSMIAVQAESARLTTPGMPDAGAERLSVIAGTARAALTEMRRLLGVLREDTERDSVERRPQPGLSQLNDLIDEARDATSTGVRLILSGAPTALDPGVELVAYRIVQEALTNARRHAPGAAVDVELHYTASALRLSIRDNGPGPTADGTGHGLLGMGERAAAVGGLLRTGYGPAGGFVVEATLPSAASR